MPLSWFLQTSDQNYKRVTEKNAILYSKQLIVQNENKEKIVFNSDYNTSDYLYGDILFMIQEGLNLIPMPLPTDVEINLIEHPQVQEFIKNSRNKLKLQIKKYEEILESLKKVDYEEENFEKQFFEEFSKLRNNLFKDSGEYLQAKMDATSKKIEKFVKEIKKSSDKDQNKNSTVTLANTIKNQKETKRSFKKVDPKIKALFSK